MGVVEFESGGTIVAGAGGAGRFGGGITFSALVTAPLTVLVGLGVTTSGPKESIELSERGSLLSSVRSLSSLMVCTLWCIWVFSIRVSNSGGGLFPEGVS